MEKEIAKQGEVLLYSDDNGKEFVNDLQNGKSSAQRCLNVNHFYQFAEFLRCCKEQKVKNIHLAEVHLLVNLASSDFGYIIIEFEQCWYLVSTKQQRYGAGFEEIDEFCVEKFERFAELKKYDLDETDIYKTISGDNQPLEFITELIDCDGYFNGMQWKYANGYLFFTASDSSIIVLASFDEELKYLFYSHQFAEDDARVLSVNTPFILFPDIGG